MTRWGKIGLSLCASVALMGTALPANADLLTFDVIPAYAPNGPTAPSWKNYVQNAIGGIQSNVDVGNRAMDPAAYERISGPVPASEIIYTPFNSWRGAASPNPAFQAPFLGELGNRFHFGLHIRAKEGSNWSFALADLAWKLDSSDSTDFFDQTGDFVGQDYSDTRVGINWGPDNAPGGGDDVTIQGGAGTQLVNELIYVGVGDGFLSFEPTAINDQQDIDTTLSDIYAGCNDPTGCLIDVTMTYTIPDHTGAAVSADGSFVLVTPEPSSAVLALIGMTALFASRRRRQQG